MTKKALVSMKDLEKQYESDVEDAAARLNKPIGNTIGIRNSKFSYKGDVIGRSMVSIIVDFVHAQTWYVNAFDPENPEPPSCHALSVTGDEMQPFADSPIKQSDWCDGCPLDAWESADVGRGKACGQQYKLAVLAAGPGETLDNAELAIMTVPPTSLKNFDAYVKHLKKKFKRPPHGVLTRFAFDEEEEHPVLIFEDEKAIGNIEDAQSVNGRREEARTLLMTPPDFTQTADPKKKTKKKTAKKRKKVVKKKAASKKAPAKKKAKKKAAKKKTAKKTATKKRGASKFS